MISALLDGCIDRELAQVSQRFQLEVASNLAPINALVKHVSRFHGKMLRPTLVLLSAKAAGRVNDSHITIATVVEMVHMATLVHDDVLDEAEMRRKGATINHLRGNEAAVLLGDYLISHSYHLCSSLDCQSASRLIAGTTNQVCEGELLQVHNRNNYALDERTYFQIIALKTASLTAACCVLGAKFASADADRVARFQSYGVSLGTAFQIQDDILDLVGDPRTVGKTLGSDIEKGKMTLPIIHFMRTAPREHRDLLLSLLQSGDPDRVEKIRNLILPSHSIQYAHDRAQHYIDLAHAALEPLPSTDAKQLLNSMADFVVTRPF